MAEIPEKVCTLTFDQPEPAAMATYERLGGYTAWRRVLAA